MPDLPEISSALGAIEVELEKLKSATEHIEESKEVAREVVEAARLFHDAVAAITEPTQRLVERLDKVDFPSRLDKLDANISALHMGFQTLQGRVDGLERTLKDEFKVVRDGIDLMDRNSAARTKELGTTLTVRANNHDKLLKQNLIAISVAMLSAFVLIGLHFAH